MIAHANPWFGRRPRRVLASARGAVLGHLVEHLVLGTPSEPVTVRNLLSNDSGRFQTNESDYVQLATREADKTAYAIGLDQQHEIGTEWVYNNAAIQVLEDVLERATGTDVGSFAAEHLFGPLGMSTTITTDPAGNTLTFMVAQMSCRDMARFGLLFLRGGEWAGEQIVSAQGGVVGVLEVDRVGHRPVDEGRGAGRDTMPEPDDRAGGVPPSDTARSTNAPIPSPSVDTASHHAEPVEQGAAFRAERRVG